MLRSISNISKTSIPADTVFKIGRREHWLFSNNVALHNDNFPLFVSEKIDDGCDQVRQSSVLSTHVTCWQSSSSKGSGNGKIVVLVVRWGQINNLYFANNNMYRFCNYCCVVLLLCRTHNHHIIPSILSEYHSLAQVIINCYASLYSFLFLFSRSTLLCHSAIPCFPLFCKSIIHFFLSLPADRNILLHRINSLKKRKKRKKRKSNGYC